MKTKKLNGKIELMRFVFTVIVILYHINNRLHFQPVHGISFSRNGNIGVEFFFLVSGFLMAAAAKKHRETAHIPKETGAFIKKKLLAILPAHGIVYCVCIALVMLSALPLKDRAYTVLDSLPDLFLVQMSGIKATPLLTPEWYISAMLWMMLIIYPLLLKFGDRFSRLVCPVLSVFLVGYMCHVHGELSGVWGFIFMDLVPQGYVRGFAEMCLGCFCYEASLYLKSKHFSKADRVFFTVAEALIYLLTAAYAFTEMRWAYQPYLLFALAFAITVSFSEVSGLSGLFNNKAVYFLGRKSFVLYISQSVALIAWKYVDRLNRLPAAQAAVGILIITAVTAVFVAFGEALIRRLIVKKEKSLTP